MRNTCISRAESSFPPIFFYLLSTYYVPGTVLSAGDTKINKAPALKNDGLEQYFSDFNV